MLGASSLVGECLLSLLSQDENRVVAFSRRAGSGTKAGVEWVRLGESPGRAQVPDNRQLPLWISVAPIWVLVDYFDVLKASGVQRVVVLSSTSRFSKLDSRDRVEKEVAIRLADSESRLQAWAEAHGVEWMILRPTLIYGYGRDKNLAVIARLIRRLGFFPVLGAADGHRQPVHAEDVAAACVAALKTAAVRNRSYNLSGGETLTYADMIRRIFVALDKSPRLLRVPSGVFALMFAVLRLLPRFRHSSAAIARRMNTDLAFDHADASRDLGFEPRRFRLTEKDLPR